jgi:hypothetical protein
LSIYILESLDKNQDFQEPLPSEIYPPRRLYLAENWRIKPPKELIKTPAKATLLTKVESRNVKSTDLVRSISSPA